MARSRKHKHPAVKKSARGLHIVALFEGAKGLLVLVAGFELLTFIHRDIHEAAMRLVEFLHFNPASHYPRIFLDLTEHMNDTRLWSLALAAAAWMRKPWAEWFAVLTGGMYVPVELYEVFRNATWPRITVLVINVGVVSYLMMVLLANNRKGHHEAVD